MPIFTVTYTKNFKGKKEIISKDVEADTFRKAQNKTRRECEEELTDYIHRWLEENPGKPYSSTLGDEKKVGLWRDKTAVLVFSDFKAVPKE